MLLTTFGLILRLLQTYLCCFCFIQIKMGRCGQHIGPPDETLGCRKPLNACGHGGMAQREAQVGSWNLVWLFI